MRLIIATALLGLIAGSATAQEDISSGGGMITACRGMISDRFTPQLEIQKGYCAGVVSAVFSSALAFQPEYRFCPPVITTKQAIRIVLKYMDDNPHQLHMPLYALAHFAFLKAYPCPN